MPAASSITGGERYFLYTSVDVRGVLAEWRSYRAAYEIVGVVVNYVNHAITHAVGDVVRDSIFLSLSNTVNISQQTTDIVDNNVDFPMYEVRFAVEERIYNIKERET